MQNQLKINYGKGIVEQYIEPKELFQANIGELKQLNNIFIYGMSNQLEYSGGKIKLLSGNIGATRISNNLENAINVSSQVKPQYNHIQKGSPYIGILQTHNIKITGIQQNKYAHSERYGYMEALDKLIDQQNYRQVIKPSLISSSSYQNEKESLFDVYYQLDREPSIYQKLLNQNKHVINTWSELRACYSKYNQLGKRYMNWIKEAYPDQSQLGYIYLEDINHDISLKILNDFHQLIKRQLNLK